MIHTVIKTANTARPGFYFAAIRIVLVVAGAVAVAAAPVVTRAAPPTLPADVVTSATPPASAIDKFMEEAVQLLRSDKSADQESGRNAIVRYAAPPANQSQPAAGFLFTYAGSLNAKLAPVAKDPNWRVRLNAIITVERVAAKANNEQLADTIKAFLSDPNEAVALWAVKASRHVMARQPAQLIPGVLDAAKRFPATATAAYQALSATPLKIEFLTATQDLLEARIARYGPAAPTDPLAEDIGIRNLVSTAAWKLQNPTQQSRTAQLLASLASGVARCLSPDISTESKDELAELLKGVAKAVSAIGVVDPTKAALLPAGQAILKQLPRAAHVDQLKAAANAVFPPLKASFPAITQPSEIAATNPTTSNDKVSGK